MTIIAVVVLVIAIIVKMYGCGGGKNNQNR